MDNAKTLKYYHNMTRKEAMMIPELDIDVTEAVEDAFYAFRDIEAKELDECLSKTPNYVSGDAHIDKLISKFNKDCKNAENAMRRLNAIADIDVRTDAILKAFKMIENVEKYGVPCADWCSE